MRMNNDAGTGILKQALILGIIFLFSTLIIPTSRPVEAKKLKKHLDWTEQFDLERCNLATTGSNKYFNLEPGYQLVLSGGDIGDTTVLTITVLSETEKIGEFETRVVEERETRGKILDEVSRNYYAFCPETGSIFYFGEDVDIYKDGKIVGHQGSWRADSPNAQPGLMMPGIILLGARYYQEIAPGIAMDRAMIISDSDAISTYVDVFKNCLKTEETSPLEPGISEFKLYAPGIGLVKDGKLTLIKKGTIQK